MPAVALEQLTHAAQQECLMPIVYKADLQLVQAAKISGWRVLHVADEMILNTTAFHTDGRSFRQLRRKLRQAKAAKVHVTRSTILPTSELARIDADWQIRKGGARGITMGRFCPSYLTHQAVMVARVSDTVVGFSNFRMGTQEWCLDLMRTSTGAPEGTMYMLITGAIEEANNKGISRLSLAALPTERGPFGWMVKRLSHASGLRRFKACFKPIAVPRFVLARSWPGLVLGLLDLWLSVRRPERALGTEQDSSSHSAAST